MRLDSRGLTVLVVALLQSSCEIAPEDGALLGDAATALPSADREIAAQLYAGAPRTPVGFYDDAAPVGFAQVTTYHVKSQQLAIPAATSYEVCSDDWNVAFAWSEEVAMGSSPYLDLVANEATARYFEFDRVPRGQPDRYVRMRVLRCSYLDRNGVDAMSGDGFAGALSVRPLDAAALRDLSEYLWSFTSYNNAGHAVLASEPRAASGIAHALTIASLERAASGSCDRVTLRDWTHTADPVTGALQLATVVVREFRVTRTGESITAC
jgi:hypothetical protein